MLSKRLKIIANEVKKEKIICDIGTDHGLLPIYLLNHNDNIKKIYAIDSKKEPLEQAKNNIKKYNIKSNNISVILSNGFDWIKDRNINIDVAIIAGLGGSTIVNILENDNNKIKRYIICANNNEMAIRKFIKEKRYFIEKEILINDKNFYYFIIIINKISGIKLKKDKDLMFGTYLLKKEKNNNYYDYWNFQLEKINKFFGNLSKKDINYKKYKKKIKLIKKELGKVKING